MVTTIDSNSVVTRSEKPLDSAPPPSSCAQLAHPLCAQALIAPDFPRTAAPTYDYRHCELPLAGTSVASARDISRDPVAIDPTIFWLAAWCTLVYRYAQQDEFQIDVEQSNRGCAGKVLKSLALCIDARTSTTQLTRSLRRTLAASSDAAKSRAIAAIGASLLSTDTMGSEGVLVETACTTMPAGRDLHLHCVRHENVTSVQLIYNAALFERDTLERLARQLTMLVRGMAQEPDRPVSQLPLMTTLETAHTLRSWRGAAQVFSPIPLARQIELHAQRAPDVIAVTHGDVQLTYGQLNRRANQIAHLLVSHGVGPGRTVAVHLGGSADAVACALGIFKAGAIYVPLDPGYPPQRLAVILEDTKPRVLFTGDTLPEELTAEASRIIVLSQQRDLLQQQPDENLPQDPALQDPAFIIYTSGTTGKPKGVMLSYGNLLHYLSVARERYQYTSNDCIPAFARFTFSITLFEVLSPLIAGARLMILDRETILDFARLTQALARVTAMHASPSLLRRWLAWLREHAIDAQIFERLRHVSSGGDVVSADLIEDLKRTFPQAEVYVIYGSSEIACMGCSFEAPRDRRVTRNYVGKPFPNVAVRLYDQHRRLVPVGVPGEIYFGGSGVALGYLNAPEITRDKFIDIEGERFYRMGDLGRFDADGRLEFLGRNDFQIKLRGMRIELLEIETTLRGLAGVKEAVVAEKPFPTGEKGLAAYVVLNPETPITTATLRRELRSKLPDYMVPSAFVVLKALPVNFNQKLDRKALPLPSADDYRNLGDYMPPRTDTERGLAAIWQALLHTDRIGARDNFFDAGGNSLLSIDLVVQIKSTFGKTVPLSVVLTEPTIERLARVLDSDASANTGVVLLREGGPLPPIFLIHDGDGEILPYRKLAYAMPADRAVYGITPLSRGQCPMLHTRLVEVVDHYTRQIISVQANGPYTLGGLCIGGFIAYEIGRRLRAAGEQVDLVALIDAAHVNAPARSVNAQRVARFMSTFERSEANKASVRAIAKKAGRKLANFTAYVVGSRLEQLKHESRIRLFRLCLDRRWPIPASLQQIPVSALLRHAEREYVLPPPYEGPVILMRATRKDPAFDGTQVDDTPYVELFEEPLLGWGAHLPNLKVYDIGGGHSSMLQDPNVTHIAGAIVENLHTERGSPVSLSA